MRGYPEANGIVGISFLKKCVPYQMDGGPYRRNGEANRLKPTPKPRNEIKLANRYRQRGKTYDEQH